MRTTRTRAIIGALAVTAVLAGCASDTDDESPDDTETETDTETDTDTEDDSDDDG